MFGNLGETMRAGVQSGETAEMHKASAKLYTAMTAFLLLMTLLMGLLLWLLRGSLPPLGPQMINTLLVVTGLFSAGSVALLEIECRRRITAVQMGEKPATAHKKACTTVLATAATFPTMWSGALLMGAFVGVAAPAQSVAAFVLAAILGGVGYSRLKPLCALAVSLRPAAASPASSADS